MVNPKTPQECFDELQDVLMTIPEEKIVYTTMPYEEAMHEGQRVAALVTKYRDRLIRSDIDPVHLDTIFERAGAVAYCVAFLESYVKISETHVNNYREKKGEGYKVRKELIEALEYVFRLDKTTLDLMKCVASLRIRCRFGPDLQSVFKCVMRLFLNVPKAFPKKPLQQNQISSFFQFPVF